MCLARHAQITQNNKFAISLQYFKKEVSDEIDFLHPDKHKSLLQINTMVLTEMVKYSQSSQNSKLAMYYNISKKKLEMKLLFCMQINVKVSYKLFSTLWALMFPTSWYYHFWWAWSSIFKVLKVITLQYLYNISKKKLGMCFIFCMQINIKVFTSWHYRFDGSGQYVQSTLNRKFLILLQYIKKNVSQLLLCSIVM